MRWAFYFFGFGVLLCISGWKWFIFTCKFMFSIVGGVVFIAVSRALLDCLVCRKALRCLLEKLLFLRSLEFHLR